MKNRWILLLANLLMIATGCDKDDRIIEDRQTARQLLTSKDWFISAAGFDDNKNGVIDASENELTDCQADNTYTFRDSGTGSVTDNALSCGNPVNTDFTWSLEANDTKIRINTETSSVLQLTKTVMLLSPDLPWLTSKYLLRYHH